MAVGNKVIYYKGVRLWQNAKHWKPSLVRTGGSRRLGVTRLLGLLNPRSPNFFYEIAAHTAVNPATIGSGPLADLGFQETFNLQMLQVYASLVDVAGTLGDLSWCQDENEVVTITQASNPGSFPGVAAFQYSGAGFTPAPGQYVLLRSPTNGHGFVTLLTAAASGAASASFAEAVAVGWEMILVRYYFPSTAFVALSGWETQVQAEDRHAFDVAYAFESGAHPKYKTTYTQDIS